jgi:methionine-rich copper-binding protein CopC
LKAKRDELLTYFCTDGINACEIVSQGKMRKLIDHTIAVDLKPLRPGNYKVEWQVLSLDTHVTEGVLRFTVAPQGN